MAKGQQELELTTLLAERWEQVSRKVTELAEAFPAGEFESRPLNGVRTAGEVLRHIAFWNEYLSDSLRGKEPDGSANELPLANYSTKASVVEALRHSSVGVVLALRDHRGSPDLKAVELALTFIEHTSEHYGQLVVYARLRGIVPPTSRI